VILINNEVKIVPTPIQRNLNDVAMELTELYFSRHSGSECTIENIQNTYKKFYATAMNAVGMDYDTADKLSGK
jgi:hypothetical protein